MKHLPLFALVMLLLAAAIGAETRSASADQVYHSSHVGLHAVAGAALNVGFVENIHPNGPQVFARERYVLVGASPDTTFDVALIIYATSGECEGDSFPVPSVSVETNHVGNGSAQLLLRPGDIPAELHGATLGIIWQFSAEGALAYETDCETVTLD